MARKRYLGLDAFFKMIPGNAPLKKLWDDHRGRMETAPGSSHNHQAWHGGYRDHIVECLNIARSLHAALAEIRPLPFSLADALTVLYLHDLEKPWKYAQAPRNPEECVCGHLRRDHWMEAGCTAKCIMCVEAGKSCAQWISALPPASKADRKAFRDKLIRAYGIQLTAEQWNALEYVEGIPDSQYTPGERVMGELAAFCHMCDICSARLWHDQGQNKAKLDKALAKWQKKVQPLQRAARSAGQLTGKDYSTRVNAK